MAARLGLPRPSVRACVMRDTTARLGAPVLSSTLAPRTKCRHRARAPQMIATVQRARRSPRVSRVKPALLAHGLRRALPNALFVRLVATVKLLDWGAVRARASAHQVTTAPRALHLRLRKLVLSTP